MPCLFSLPGNQQVWHLLYRINWSLSSMRRDFNQLNHLRVEKWYKIQISYMFSWNKFTRTKYNVIKSISQTSSNFSTTLHLHNSIDVSHLMCLSLKTDRQLVGRLVVSLITSKHWFSSWLGAVRHQAIYWINVDQLLQCHIGLTRPNQ